VSNKKGNASDAGEREAELRCWMVSVKSLRGLCESFLQTSNFDEFERRGIFEWINGVLFF
jgi:hypothetical protein